MDKNKKLTLRTAGGSGKLWVTYTTKNELELHTDLDKQSEPITVTQYSVTGIKNTGDKPWELVVFFDPAFEPGDEVGLNNRPWEEVPSSFFLHYSDDTQIQQQLSTL